MSNETKLDVFEAVWNRLAGYIGNIFEGKQLLGGKQ